MKKRQKLTCNILPLYLAVCDFIQKTSLQYCPISKKNKKILSLETAQI